MSDLRPHSKKSISESDLEFAYSPELERKLYRSTAAVLASNSNAVSSTRPFQLNAGPCGRSPLLGMSESLPIDSEVKHFRFW